MYNVKSLRFGLNVELFDIAILPFDSSFLRLEYLFPGLLDIVINKVVVNIGHPI
jgi:hypothetical protein